MDSKIILSQLGFSNHETAIYLSTMELGMAPISSIARKANMKRTTAYGIIDKLCNKGFAERFLKHKVHYYSVISPAALHSKFQSTVANLEAQVPELMARYNTLDRKPHITFYEGKEDITQLYLDVLTAKNKLVQNYFEPEKNIRYFTKDWLNKNHIQKRIELGIQLRVIIPKSSKWFEHYKGVSKNELREIRMIDAPDLFLYNETYIYDNKMSVFSFDEEFALLIESEDVIRTQKTMFELAWNSSLVKKPT